MSKPAGKVVVSFSAILLILVIYFVYPRDHCPIIRAIDLRPWSWRSGGSLFIKDANDGTSDLLMMSLGQDSFYALKENPSISAKKLSDARPLLRYIAAQNILVEVPPELWDTSTGTMATWWTQPGRLTNRGTFTHDLLTMLLQFNGKVVPTAGPTVLRTQPDPSETYVAVLSAEGRLRKSWMPFGDPTIRGDRYHQLFRMSDGTEVGNPLKLKMATDGNYASPSWSADGRYIVYKELSERLWIIDASKTLAAEEGR